MGIFDKIKHAIFGDKGPLGTWADGKSGAPTPPQPVPHAAPAAQANPAPGAPPPAPQAAPQAAPAAAAPVDVEAILGAKAAAFGKPNNWRTSIVDLLTLLGLDSSLAARKELAEDLGVHAGEPGSAEQNIALHKAVMQALAKNGGKVPAALTD